MCDIDYVLEEAIRRNPQTFTKDADIEVAEFREFKLKWMRSYGWVRFSISDYILAAPDDVAIDLFTTLFDKIVGKKTDYPDSVANYLMGREFALANQKTFVSRVKGFKASHRLFWSLYRLQKANRVVGADIVYGFAPMTSADETSAMFRVAILNEKLASASKELLDYALFKAIAFIEVDAGFQDNMGRRERAQELIDSYPERDRLELELMALVCD